MPTVNYHLDEEDAAFDHRVEGQPDYILLRNKTSFAANPGTLYVAEVSPVSDESSLLIELYILAGLGFLCLLACLVESAAKSFETCDCCYCCCCYVAQSRQRGEDVWLPPQSLVWRRANAFDPPPSYSAATSRSNQQEEEMIELSSTSLTVPD
jgi:hypothetical protein